MFAAYERICPSLMETIHCTLEFHVQMTLLIWPALFMPPGITFFYTQNTADILVLNVLCLHTNENIPFRYVINVLPRISITL